jgi:Fe-S-cluster-containing dehydrogenase component/DMSO reductase anchor subunit
MGMGMTSTVLKDRWIAPAAPGTGQGSGGGKRLPLIQQYIAEQQQLTAVEQFSQLHAAEQLPLQSRYYRALLPTAKPGEGQQYAFSVDLDKCTGCKACVTACHNLNGLDENETWRAVGLLHGGDADSPMQQTVTTACHHCLEPACLKGCPVKAYEKDPVTGIVKHLDDQCIGCQYCTFTCPYEVPQFNSRLGIVRKCDLCSDRLAVGEAPACVQACPNEAIAIRIVDRATVRENAQEDPFLPGAPSPGITLPTTEYKTRRVFPKNTLPADFYSVRAAHDHWPLAFFLVFNQLSIGTVALDWLHGVIGSAPELHPHWALAAFGAGALALAVSIFHLGRPLYAFRAFLGLRHSWMSREIIAVGAYSGLSALYAALFWAPALLRWPSWVPATLEALAHGVGATLALIGMGVIFCSSMCYAVTGRVWWQLVYSGPRFYASAAIQGLALTLAVSAAADATGVSVPTGLLLGTCKALLIVTAAKLVFEASVFSHLRSNRVTDLKRTALLMSGELARVTVTRFVVGGLGGLLFPLLFTRLIDSSPASMLGSTPVVVAVLGCLLVIGGEILERVLFFRAVASRKMPGALGS